MVQDIVSLRLFNGLTWNKNLTQTEILHIGECTLDALKYPSKTREFLKGRETELLPTQLCCAFFACGHAQFRDALKTMSKLLCALEYCSLEHCRRSGGDRLSQDDRLQFQILYQESLDILHKNQSIKLLQRRSQCKEILFSYAFYLFNICDYPEPDVEMHADLLWPSSAKEHHFVAFHKMLVGQA